MSLVLFLFTGENGQGELGLENMERQTNSAHYLNRVQIDESVDEHDKPVRILTLEAVEGVFAFVITHEAAEVAEPFRSTAVSYVWKPKEPDMTFRSTIAASIFLAGTALATAQTVVVTPEQEVVVREYVKTNPVVVERPSNFELVLGAIIPDILKPGELAENTLPNKYQYVQMDGRTVLIDPATRKGVHIIQ